MLQHHIETIRTYSRSQIEVGEKVIPDLLNKHIVDRSHFGNWVDEQSLERLELGAEKKLRMEEVHELDRMWDSIRYQIIISSWSGNN